MEFVRMFEATPQLIKAFKRKGVGENWGEQQIKAIGDGSLLLYTLEDGSCFVAIFGVWCEVGVAEEDYSRVFPILGAFLASYCEVMGISHLLFSVSASNPAFARALRDHLGAQTDRLVQRFDPKTLPVVPDVAAEPVEPEPVEPEPVEPEVTPVLRPPPNLRNSKRAPRHSREEEYPLPDEARRM